MQNKDNSRSVRFQNPTSLHTSQEATEDLLHLNRQIRRGGGSPAQEGRSPARGRGRTEWPRSSQGDRACRPGGHCPTHGALDKGSSACHAQKTKQPKVRQLLTQAPQAQLPTMPTRWDERSRMVRQAGHFLQRQVKTKSRQKDLKTARAAAVASRLKELEAAFLGGGGGTDNCASQNVKTISGVCSGYFDKNK